MIILVSVLRQESSCTICTKVHYQTALCNRPVEPFALYDLVERSLGSKCYPLNKNYLHVVATFIGNGNVLIRMQKNALIQHFKIEDPFFTTVMVRIAFLYTYFEREYIKKA